MRTFTDMESRQAKGSASKLAGSFACEGKLVAKALGTGFRTFMPIDVEVLRDDMGKPYVRLYRGALKRFQEMGMERLEVSITNTREYAMAFAVGEGRIKERYSQMGMLVTGKQMKAIDAYTIHTIGNPLPGPDGAGSS